MNAATWILSALAAIAIAGAGMALDGPDEMQAAQDVADYAAAVADGGVSMCAEFGRVPTWTKAGDLVCRSAKSEPVLVVGGRP